MFAPPASIKCRCVTSVALPLTVAVKNVGKTENSLSIPRLGVRQPYEEISIGNILWQDPRGNSALRNDVQRQVQVLPVRVLQSTGIDHLARNSRFQQPSLHDEIGRGFVVRGKACFRCVDQEQTVQLLASAPIWMLRQ